MPSPQARLVRRAANSPCSGWASRDSAVRRPLTAALGTVILLVLVIGAPAYADPSTPKASSTPTIDSAAPTPTAPAATVEQGYGPGGITIGGPSLNTRGLITYPGAPALPPNIDARGFVVADLGTGQVLAAQDPHGKYYPASTLKTLTFISLYPTLDPNQVLTATREDATVEGSRVGIVENGQYTVGQLWTALMLQSGNDAARMLTTAAGGDTIALALMNEQARKLQAYDTLAGTTSGLDVTGQSSSPYDLALFMREIVQNPALRAISAQTLGQLPPQPPKYPEPLNFGNQNHLMLSYPGSIAGKNGFTDAARHTFVAAAERNGRTLVVSLMQAEQQPVPTWQQAAALLDWGFTTTADAQGAGKLVTPDEVSEAPPASSSAAQAAADGAPASAQPQAGSAGASGRRELTTWPLLPILGILLGVAIWIAAPRRERPQRRDANDDKRSSD